MSQNGGIGEAEADVELLYLVPATATADRDAALVVEHIKLETLIAEATWRQRELVASHGGSGRSTEDGYTMANK
jgi:hypothetical protein